MGSIAAILCLASSPAAVASHQVIEGPARVVDGDTLEVCACHSMQISHAAASYGRHSNCPGHVQQVWALCTFALKGKHCCTCRCQESAYASLVLMRQRSCSHAAIEVADHIPAVSTMSRLAVRCACFSLLATRSQSPDSGALHSYCQ